MSDMNQENLFQDPEQQNQAGQTRAVTPVETSSRPARRRRSERYQDEAPAETQSAVASQPIMTNEPVVAPIQEPAAPVAAPTSAVPPATMAASTSVVPPAPIAAAEENEPTPPRPQTRVVMPQEPVSGQSSPRPRALSRAEGAAMQSSAQDNGAAVRRPMGTPPGFTPRQPVVAESRESSGRPAQASRVSAGGADPRSLPASTGNSVRRPATGYEQNAIRMPQKRKSHKWLVALVIFLLLIGLAIVAVMVLGQNDDGMLGQVYDKVSGLWGNGDEEPAVAASASGFTAAIERGTAPMDVVFNLTTSKSVSEVRLVDEGGFPLNAMSNPVTENADSIIWMINLPVTDGYEGLVFAQIYDGTEWLDTGRSQQLEISMPSPTATVDVAVFIEATDEPTAALTEEPIEPWDDGFVGAEEPIEPFGVDSFDAPPEAVTATPTLAVTNTPAIAQAATSTPLPAALAATQVPMAIAQAPMTEYVPEDGAEPSEAPLDEPIDDEPFDEPVEDEPVEDEPVEDEPTEDEPVDDEPTDQPTATAPLTAIAADSADPSLIKDTVIYNGSSKVDSYTRERVLNMPVADNYLTQPYGVLTYRGNAFRQNASVGTVGEISEMAIAWKAEAGSAKGSSSTYYGIGWTGQPAIIKWSKEVRAATNINANKKDTTALKEVIIAGLDGNIYFLDLTDGAATRNPINLGFPMRGTPSLHPLGYPIMAVGQYGRRMASGTGDIGLRVYNLLDQKQAYFIDGLDGGKKRRTYYEVGAFDTSALIDPNTDTMVAIGTNGMLYTALLNTEYSVMDATVSINPSMVSMISRISKQAGKYTAVQSSPAMYANYVYYADMQGILRCVDTTTMTTVWAVDTEDAVEASIALDLDDNGDLWLYTANTLEYRKKGDSTIRRYNALTGEESWSLPVGVTLGKNEKIPGAMASPVVGQHELSDMVYFTLSNVSSSGAATLREGENMLQSVLIALDKDTGSVNWSLPMDAYSYSSPVAVYTEEGTGYIIQACSDGTLMLLDGRTGAMIDTLELEGTLDASPAVYNDTLVIGTTGKNTAYIYGIKLQ